MDCLEDSRLIFFVWTKIRGFQAPNGRIPRASSKIEKLISFRERAISMLDVETICEPCVTI
jgi:hypothetical protein